jgi:catechol 2,3-dioxygenase-like lactoylglutathione lyase family enzyme
MFLDGDGLPSYVNEFPPSMIPASDLNGDGEEDNDSSSTLLGGHAIVYVSNMDAGIRFYSEKLGMRLTNRFGDDFATVEAGNFILAIHPKTPMTPDPGTKGSVMLGLQVDEPLDRVVSRLTERGVQMTGSNAPRTSENLVEFEDEDGNTIYLWEARAIASRAAVLR